MRVVDHRYSRFALDPRTGLFSMTRYPAFRSVCRALIDFGVIDSAWRDASWSGLQSVQNGLEESTRRQRFTLFGNNEIDIEEKSALSLLIDEVTYRRPNMLKPATDLVLLLDHSSILRFPDYHYYRLEP
jgi:cation-transporting ATPase 13A3/4/5